MMSCARPGWMMSFFAMAYHTPAQVAAIREQRALYAVADIFMGQDVWCTNMKDHRAAFVETFNCTITAPDYFVLSLRTPNKPIAMMDPEDIIASLFRAQPTKKVVVRCSDVDGPLGYLGISACYEDDWARSY